MAEEVLLSPPIAFLIVLSTLAILGVIFSKASFKNKQKSAGTGKAYACGEDIPDHLSQPDYSQFFPFAFFFTIAHVATLMLTTVPAESPQVFFIALIYISAVVVSLIVLFRR